MRTPIQICLSLLLTMAVQKGYSQCPLGTVVTVTNNLGSNTNGSLAWALDCLDNAGATLTTVQFDIDGSTEIQPSAVAPLTVGEPGVTINGANLGSGGPIILDGGSPAGPAPNGITLVQPNITVQDLIIRNFTSSSGGNGILISADGANIQGNTVTGNRVGIATTSGVSSFTIASNTVGASGEGNTIQGISITGLPTTGVISGNEIAFNSGSGINIVAGSVLITNNSTYCNTASGITRPTPPLPPNITFATSQEIRGTAVANQVIEVFVHSPVGCAGAPVQGKTYLGTTVTPAAGPWVLSLVSGSVAPNDEVTATSTENANNTSVFSAPATVLDCAAFIAGINETDVSCAGADNGAASAIPNGPSFTYSWDNGATTSAISNLAPGTYTVTVTNSAGCTDSQTASITEPPLLSVSVAPTPVSCFGGNNGIAAATPAGGTPGYGYNWSNGQTGATASGLIAGSYTVTITDLNTCTSTQATSITQPSDLIVSIVSNPVTCFGANSGAAIATPNGGTPGYTYTWNNGQTNQTAIGLVAGSYAVTVKDLNSCTETQTIIITQPPALTLGVNSTDETDTGADGTATASPNGGTPPFNYSWSNGSTNAQIFNLLPGTYIVTITDMNGCTITGSATVGAVTGGACTALPVYAVLGPAQVCGNTAFTLEADDLYPNPAVQYVWLFPNGDSAVTIQPTLELTATSSAFSGAYFVLRDSAGCRSIPVGGATLNVLTVDNLFAGNDTVICSAGFVNLHATLPASGIGSWRSLGAATVDNPAQRMTIGRNLQPGRNVFVWQVALANCPQAATDTVVYFLENKPVVKDDSYTLYRALDVAVMEVMLNDALAGLPDTVLLQVSTPAIGDLELLAENRRFRYTIGDDFRGTVMFQYAICSPATVCNLPCDTATVTIAIQNMPTVPTGLVVEDPGLNGALTIKGIRGFTRVAITITDRWGDLVFQEQEYDNDNPWVGNYKRTGNYLPGGAYYYFLKAYDGQTQVGETMTGVIHLFEK